MPHPLGNLLLLSFALYRTDDCDFDPYKTKAFLEERNLLEERAVIPRCILAYDDDPMEILEELTDFCNEVDEITDLFAQSVNAAVETFDNPGAEIRPIVLSTAEYIRIAGSFWILKLYYQLHLKFARLYNNGQSGFIEWITHFVHCLRSWQVEQVLSVQLFIESCGTFSASAMYGLIDEKYNSRERLQEQSSYFRNLATANRSLCNPAPYTTGVYYPISFERAARMRFFGYGPRASPWNSIPRVCPEDTLRPREVIGRNHGWILFETVRKNGDIFPSSYRHLFLDLGVFFWDQDRLMLWGLADPSDISTICASFKERIRQAHAQFEVMNFHDYQDFIQRRKSEWIVQWTRRPVQCSSEEW
ncbi:hypothetical protein K469DRAFT_384137 [Zopfia rhizophila CBS 207.26]|uniref:Uncharacterized protein n=1 Tax=Zopfia rhizophila CBS 207.26 TaxID=1314779 RepID=A0A6A6EI87_9PEZI|nr:hypothetical protein K469DRAFT_384137 [Zopfia rhizophila CBS 207.26]